MISPQTHSVLAEIIEGIDRFSKSFYCTREAYSVQSAGVKQPFVSVVASGSNAGVGASPPEGITAVGRSQWPRMSSQLVSVAATIRLRAAKENKSGFPCKLAGETA